MRQLNEETLTAEVVARLSKTKNPRLREIMASAVKHLHASRATCISPRRNGSRASSS